jgi:hypothetical protein
LYPMVQLMKFKWYFWRYFEFCFSRVVFYWISRIHSLWMSWRFSNLLFQLPSAPSIFVFGLVQKRYPKYLYEQACGRIVHLQTCTRKTWSLQNMIWGELILLIQEGDQISYRGHQNVNFKRRRNSMAFSKKL